MNKCTDCINENICKGNRRKGSHANCFQPKPITNYDRIRNMSAEEIVEFINKNYKCQKCAYYNKCCDSNCESGIKLWLMKEVSENETL